ncbi:hypothetical protein [Deinococcus actinosclerus]|uniref:Transcriptional regulator n=1 Tax=Deinococcus actinosclerus TaxID=1768108 RepID=A0ABN4K0V9_9DEIO|nr:hypothetical protein [Deinococcus actinosclerus]ALW87844.1 hypothetical protein AUC44_02160 [Deinococcus actinosclerus]
MKRHTKSSDRPAQGDRETRSHAAPHARAAHRTLMKGLRDAGHTVTTVDAAIKLGLLTERDWCEELERQRDAHNVGKRQS